MRPDLQTARVRPVGSGGIAHRTTAGFAVVGTPDIQSVLPVIEAHQGDPALVEMVVQQLAAEPVGGFAMFFTSGGEAFVVISGTGRVTLTSGSVSVDLRAEPERIALVPVGLSVNDVAGTMLMRHSDVPLERPAGLGNLVDLHAGTVLADALEISFGLLETPATTTAPTPRFEPSGAVIGGTELEATDGATVIPIGDDAGQDEPADPVFAPDFDAPAEVVAEAALTAADDGLEAEAAVESLVGQPAADEIPFAEEPAAADPPPMGASSGPTPGFIPGAGALAMAGGGIFGAFADATNDEPPAVLDTPAPSTPTPPSFAPPPGPEPDPLPTEAAVAPVEPAAVMPATGPTTPAPPAGPEAAVFVGAETPVNEQATVGPVMVLGVACPDGHHNHPDAVYCSQCGAKMGVHNTTVLLNGPRPPLGVLVVDDGTTWSLSSDLVIGREPSAHPSVVAGSSQCMTLADETLAMSRQHASISLDEWSVYVIDLQSSNGTFINRDRAAQEWSPVPSDVRVPLEPGDRLRIGGRIISVELHHVR